MSSADLRLARKSMLVAKARVAGVTFVLALAACSASNKPAVSLEEARKVTAQVQAEGVAPPRTISDITAVLDQQKPDPAKVAAAKAIADAQPPSGLEAVEAAQFYFQRGSAAGDLGREAQRLADYRKAVELLEPFKGSRPEDYVWFAGLLAAAEIRSGHIRTAIKLRQELVNFGQLTPGIRGSLFNEYYNLAAAEARLGELDAANAWLAKADALLIEAPSWRRGQIYMPLFRSRVDWAHAEVLDSQGRFAEAEGFLRRAVAGQSEAIEVMKDRFDDPRSEAWETARDLMTRDLAVNLARRGRLIEAEIEARRALLGQLRARGRYATETAQMIFSLGFVIAEQGRYAEAEKLDRAAIDIYLNLGHGPDSPPLSAARRNLAHTLVAERKWGEALEQFDLIRQGLSGDAALVQTMVGTNLDFAAAALHSGRLDDALTVTRRAVERRARTLGERHYMTAMARGFEAVALGAAGDRAGAMAEYRAAVPILLQGSRRATDDEGSETARDARLRAVLEGYLGQLAAQPGGAGSDAVTEAFRIADAARGRTVQRALAASAARAAVRDPALAELVRGEQDAQRQAAALNGLLANVLALPLDQQDAKAIAAVRTQVDELRRARAKIRQDIEQRFPEYINLIDPRPATVAEAQAALQVGEALIAIYVAEDRTYVWAVPKEGPVAFTTSLLGRAEVEAMVAQLRRALEPNASTLGEIPPFDVALAYKLYAELLRPVEPGWKGAKGLIVVPHGALAQLPLALLVTAPATLAPEQVGEPLFSGYRRVPWLARESSVTQLPSVASLATLRALAAAPAGRKPFVGFGDPWFSPAQAAEAQRETAEHAVQLAALAGSEAMAMRSMPVRLRSLPKTETVDSAELAQLPRLPETAAEVRDVAAALKANPATDVLLGARANERAVRTMRLDDRRVVMFATHGLVSGDLNGLEEPALALSAPQVARVEGDGLLTTGKILGLKLDADWVVLSACNTAAGNGAGAEAVSGLGLAFFYAGTRAVLVTNWPVETTSARALTTALFRREAEGQGMQRADALRQAELELIDGPGYVDSARGRSIFSYAHPIFWAPFSLVGDGGQG